MGPLTGKLPVAATSLKDECLSHHSFLRSQPFHTFGGLSRLSTHCYMSLECHGQDYVSNIDFSAYFMSTHLISQKYENF